MGTPEVPEAQKVPAPVGTGACVPVDAGLCGNLQGDLSMQLLIQEPNTWFSVGMIYPSCPLPPPPVCPRSLVWSLGFVLLSCDLSHQQGCLQWALNTELCFPGHRQIMGAAVMVSPALFTISFSAFPDGGVRSCLKAQILQETWLLWSQDKVSYLHSVPAVCYGNGLLSQFWNQMHVENGKTMELRLPAESCAVVAKVTDAVLSPTGLAKVIFIHWELWFKPHCKELLMVPKESPDW